jgi:hypothetical protein
MALVASNLTAPPLSRSPSAPHQLILDSLRTERHRCHSSHSTPAHLHNPSVSKLTHTPSQGQGAWTEGHSLPPLAPRRCALALPLARPQPAPCQLPAASLFCVLSLRVSTALPLAPGPGPRTNIKPRSGEMKNGKTEKSLKCPHNMQLTCNKPPPALGCEIRVDVTPRDQVECTRSMPKRLIDTRGMPPNNNNRARNRVTHPPPASPRAVRALRPASRLPVRAHCQHPNGTPPPPAPAMVYLEVSSRE